ncbi:MAG: hypothetical protein JWO36_5744, partial [Myxococcales bacterium]|nr:hypothetical protein [Myxococcales bacterium]
LGNMTTSGSSTTYGWNYKNQILSATVSGTTTSFAYDQEGNRIRMVGSGTTTDYASTLYSVANNVPTKHIFANGILVATLVGSGTSTAFHYLHTDELTGANVVTNASATIEEVLDYTPYGTTRLDTPTAGYSEVRKFAGQEKDDATGLSFMGARYYQPVLGRFTSEDPDFLSLGASNAGGNFGGSAASLSKLLVDPQALNSYSYARNNPTRYIDPSGRAYIEVSASGDFLLLGASFGARFDSSGIDLFVSGGPSIGIGLTTRAAYSSGDLNHASSINVSRNAEAAYDFGLGVSRQGNFDPSHPFSVSKNQSTEYALVAGIGASVSQEYSISIPLPAPTPWIQWPRSSIGASPSQESIKQPLRASQLSLPTNQARNSAVTDTSTVRNLKANKTHP